MDINFLSSILEWGVEVDDFYHKWIDVIFLDWQTVTRWRKDDGTVLSYYMKSIYAEYLAKQNNIANEIGEEFSSLEELLEWLRNSRTVDHHDHFLADLACMTLLNPSDVNDPVAFVELVTTNTPLSKLNIAKQIQRNVKVFPQNVLTSFFNRELISIENEHNYEMVKIMKRFKKHCLLIPTRKTIGWFVKPPR